MSARADDPLLLDEDLPPPIEPGRARRGSRSKAPAILALVAVMAAAGFLVWRALGTATVYFRTADEAVAERADLGSRRFRIEGIVKVGTIRQEPDRLRFTIYGDRGTEVAIVHTGGQPTGLFKESVPVVLEGRWADDGSVYESDRVIVKHSETYRAENPERVRDYQPKPQP